MFAQLIQTKMIQLTGGVVAHQMKRKYRLLDDCNHQTLAKGYPGILNGGIRTPTPSL